MKYDELPRACQMMLQYAGVEYLEEQHSPSMEDLPTWISDEELGYSSRPPPSRPRVGPTGRRTSVDSISNNYDMDGKTAQSFVLVWSLGSKLGLIPDDATELENCVALEQELFYLMNNMTWMINKVRHTPSTDANVKATFSRRCNLKLPNVNKILSKFTSGEKPVYVHFIAYACIHDMRSFVPRCFRGSTNLAVNSVVLHMEGLSQLKEWFEKGGKEATYIRSGVTIGPTKLAVLESPGVRTGSLDPLGA